MLYNKSSKQLKEELLKLENNKAVLLSKKEQLNSLKNKCNYIEKEKDEVTKRSNMLKSTLNFCNLCIASRLEIKENVEDIINELLSSVFGQTYKFEYCPIIKNNVAVGLERVLYKHNQVVDPVKDGGGVQNIIAFGHMIAYLLLNPDLSPVMILDEPMNNVSQDNWSKIILKLKELSKLFNIQFGFISHNVTDYSDIQEIKVIPKGNFESIVSTQNPY